MNVAVAAATYERMKISRGEWHGQHTIRNNRLYLWHFVTGLPAQVAVDVCRVRREHIQAWLDANPAHSAVYRAGRRSAVRGLFRWLHQEGHIARDPTVGVTIADVPAPVLRSLHDHEVEVLFAAARHDPRDLMLVSFAFNEGLRNIEQARAIVGDLDERTATMEIRGKFHRGEVSRTIAVSGDTMTAVDRYRTAAGVRGGPLVQSRVQPGVGISTFQVGKLITAVIKDAGLKRFPWDGRSAHAGRRTAATQALEAGVAAELIKRQHGWSSDAMLQRYTKGAALDLHEIHRLRAERRELLGAASERLG